MIDQRLLHFFQIPIHRQTAPLASRKKRVDDYNFALEQITVETHFRPVLIDEFDICEVLLRRFLGGSAGLSWGSRRCLLLTTSGHRRAVYPARNHECHREKKQPSIVCCSLHLCVKTHHCFITRKFIGMV